MDVEQLLQLSLLVLQAREQPRFLLLDLVYLPFSSDQLRGYVAGLLASAMPFGRVPVSPIWGAAADRCGTRACLLFSMASLCVGNLMFALCRPLWAAMLARGVFLGAGNGFVAILAPLILEVGGFERQAHVIGYVTGGGTLMGLMGPAIGAYSYGVSAASPALVPSLIGCGLAAAAAVLARCWLP